MNGRGDARSARGWRIVGAIVAAALLAGELLYHPHPHFGWDGWFGFHVVVGLAAAWLLAAAARLLRPLIARDEAYYDR